MNKTVNRHTEVFIGGKSVKTSEPYYNLESTHVRLKEFVTFVEGLYFGDDLPDDTQDAVDNLIHETYALQSDFEEKFSKD